MSHNVLEVLPDSLSGLQELTHLNCSHNHLTAFPKVSSHMPPAVSSCWWSGGLLLSHGYRLSPHWQSCKC